MMLVEIYFRGLSGGDVRAGAYRMPAVPRVGDELLLPPYNLGTDTVIAVVWALGWKNGESVARVYIADKDDQRATISGQPSSRHPVRYSTVSP